MKRAFLVAALVAAIAVGVAGATGGPSLSNPSSLHKTPPAIFKAKFVTTQGPFVITVHRSWAPIAAKRFYNLVYYHYYDNQPLFRVLTHYLAQWGIYMKPSIAKVWRTAYIKDETATQKNGRGKVTFAVSTAKNSRTTQIFVNLKANAFAGRFAPFGEVTKGLSVFGDIYHGYGDYPANAPNQNSMYKYGGSWVHKYFPKLDWIKTARIVP